MTELDDVVKTVALVLGARNVQPDDRIVEDLGAESADVVNIIATVEEKYKIFVDEAALADVRTVKDLYDAVQGRA